MSEKIKHIGLTEFAKKYDMVKISTEEYINSRKVGYAVFIISNAAYPAFYYLTKTAEQTKTVLDNIEKETNLVYDDLSPSCNSQRTAHTYDVKYRIPGSLVYAYNKDIWENAVSKRTEEEITKDKEFDETCDKVLK